MYKSLLIFLAIAGVLFQLSNSSPLCEELCGIEPCSCAEIKARSREAEKLRILSLRRVARLEQGAQTYEPAKCQNTYDGETQMFYINGRQNDNFVSKVKDGYVVTRGIGAHKLYARKIVWNTAREACIRDGGHLAIINSVAEEKILVDLIQKANMVEAWIGIHDLFEEGDWITLTGESLEKAGFDTWSTLWPNEPDNLGGAQNCGVIRKEGAMDDIVCSSFASYICEIDIF